MKPEDGCFTQLKRVSFLINLINCCIETDRMV